MPAPPRILHLLSRSAVQAFHIAAGRPVSLVTLWLFTGLVLVALCTRSGLRMYPLRLYHGPPLFVVYTVSCITPTLPVAHVWHACVLVVAVHGFWFVARLWVDSLLHTVTKSVSFRHLQACHSRWAPCHLPLVLCLFPRWASCISQVLAQPHLGHPTLQVLFHLGARPPSTRLLSPLIPLPH